MGTKIKTKITDRVRLLSSKIMLMILTMLGFALSVPAAASYIPFNTNVNMNVGIGTSTPQGALTVMSGNVGIGTWAPAHALQVNGDIYNGANYMYSNVYYSSANATYYVAPSAGAGISAILANKVLIIS